MVSINIKIVCVRGSYLYTRQGYMVVYIPSFNILDTIFIKCTKNAVVKVNLLNS